jgi:hypothetical protein
VPKLPPARIALESIKHGVQKGAHHGSGYRTPICSSVFRFARQFDVSIVEDAARRMKDEYFFEDVDEGVNLKYEVGAPRAELETAWKGRKLSFNRPRRLSVLQNEYACV